MFILVVDRKNRSLIRLLNGWNNPGPTNKKLPEGVLLEKLGSNIFLFSDMDRAFRELLTLKGRHQRDTRLYKVDRELSYRDMRDQNF